MKEFQDGYDYFLQLASTTFSANVEDEYINEVNESIEKMLSDIDALNGRNKRIDFLKGDVAEVFLADSFNINATIKHSEHRVTAVRSTELGSADLVSNFGRIFGLKYYKDAKSSVDAQSLSVFDKYSKYCKKHPDTSLDAYLKMYNITSDDVYNDLIYKGQLLVIPSDQYDEAVKYLETKIKVEQATRPELVGRLKEVLAALQGCVSDDEGISSVSLSEQQSKELARLYAKGMLSEETLKSFGISPKQLIEIEDIIREAFNAGVDAAVITFSLKVAPILLKCFYELISLQGISEETIKKLGSESLTATAESFVRGGLSSALTLLCKSGKLGEPCIDISPESIALATVIAMDIFKNTLDFALGKKTSRDVAISIFRDTFIVCMTQMTGKLFQSFIKVPVIGYMIGSLIGSIIGNAISQGVSSMILGICVNTGFTLFGIVEQSYELPEEVFKQLGVDIFEYDQFENDDFEFDEFKFDEFIFDEFEHEEFEIKPLKRGLVAAYKVDYI